MKRFAIFASPLVVIALVLFGPHVARGEDQPTATGGISVTVTDKDGKAVEGATVRVTAPKQALPREPKPADDAKQAEKPKATPVAEGRTDKNGNLMLEKIPPGAYNLAVNVKGTGSDRKRISVNAGETLRVQLKLMPRSEAK